MLNSRQKKAFRAAEVQPEASANDVQINWTRREKLIGDDGNQ